MHASVLSTLSAFDWFLAILIAASVLGALRRGFIRTVFSLVGVLAGLLLAGWNYLALARHLSPPIANFAAAQGVAFLVILVAVALAASLLAGLMRRAVALVGLGLVDRLLGALFGLARGVLAASAVVMALTAFVPGASWLRGSRIIPLLLPATHALSFVVPQDLQRQISRGRAYLLQKTPHIPEPASNSEPTH